MFRFLLALFICTQLHAVKEVMVFENNQEEFNERKKKLIADCDTKLQKINEELEKKKDGLKKIKDEIENKKQDIVKKLKNIHLKYDSIVELVKGYLVLGGNIDDRAIKTVKQRLILQKEDEVLKKERTDIISKFRNGDESFIRNYLGLNYEQGCKYFLDTNTETIAKFFLLPVMNPCALFFAICKSHREGSEIWTKWFLENKICTANSRQVNAKHRRTILMELIEHVLNHETAEEFSEIIAKKMWLIVENTTKNIDASLLDDQQKDLIDYLNRVVKKGKTWREQNYYFTQITKQIRDKYETNSF